MSRGRRAYWVVVVLVAVGGVVYCGRDPFEGQTVTVPPAEIEPSAELTERPGEREQEPTSATAERGAVEPPAPEPVATEHVFQERLAIRVVDPSGAPVAEVGIFASTERGLGGVRLNGRTDADGLCRLDLPLRTPLPGETLSVGLSPPAPWKQLAWKGSFPSDTLEIVLQSGGILRGEVRYEDGDELVPDGSLGVMWDLGDGRTGNVQTPIEDGRYELAGVAGDVHEVYLFRPGERLLRRQISLLVRDDTERDYDAVFFRGLPVEVDVVDADDGTPIVGASVEVQYSTRGVTDEAGHVVLERALARVGAARLLVTHGDYQKGNVAVAADPGTPLVARRVELSRAHVLEGVVVDPRGVPQAELEVRCKLQELSPSGMGSRRSLFERAALTDEEGRFRIAGVPTCSGLDVVIRRSVQGERWLVKETYAIHTIDVPRDLDRGEWLIDDPVVVSGRVVDHEGAPVFEMYLAIHSRRGIAGSEIKTDEDGRFSFTGLFPGPWSVAVAYDVIDDVDGYRFARQHLVEVDVGPAGRDDIEIQLPQIPDTPPLKGAVELRVSDAATGQPIETGYTFLMANGVDYEASRALTGPTFEGGRFVFWAPEGRWDVWLWHDDYESFNQTVDISGGFDPLVVEVRLQRKDG
jgi:hypothetical protein